MLVGQSVDVQAGVTEAGISVAAADIARIAGVGKAAVSNWRKRFPDFPEPSGGTAASPVFALEAVESWLRAHGKLVRLSDEERLWQLLRASVEDLRLGELLGDVGLLLVCAARNPRRWRELSDAPDMDLTAALPELLRDYGPELPELADPEWAEPGRLHCLRSITRLAGLPEAAESAAPEALEACREAYEALVMRYRSARGRWSGSDLQPVGEFMRQLTEPAVGTVLDPHCLTGDLLLAAQQQGSTPVLGQTPDPGQARIAAARLALSGAQAHITDLDGLHGDSFTGELADTVLCSPPFSDRNWGFDELAGDLRWEFGMPPRSESELAWLQHCLYHTRHGGQLAMVMPTAAASRRSGRRIRGALLRAGAIRAVLELPDALGTGLGATSPQLWLLQRPSPDQAPPSHLLLAERSATVEGQQRAVRIMREGARRELPHGCHRVRVIDLLDEDVDLGPEQIRRTMVPSESTGQYPTLREGFLASLADVHGRVPNLALQENGGQHAAGTSIAELLRTGSLLLHQAPMSLGSSDGALPVLSGSDLRHGREPTGRMRSHPGAVTIQPGDVLFHGSANSLLVRVADAQAGATLGAGLALLRCDPGRLDPEFLAGQLRVGALAEQRAATGSSLRFDARRVTIPPLSLDQQRRQGRVFAELARFEQSLQELTERGRALQRIALGGLAAGTIGPESDHA